MNGEENDQIDIRSIFTDDLIIPKDFNLSFIDKNGENVIFKWIKYNDDSQTKINYIFKCQPKNNTIFKNFKNNVINLD